MQRSRKSLKLKRSLEANRYQIRSHLIIVIKKKTERSINPRKIGDLDKKLWKKARGNQSSSELEIVYTDKEKAFKAILERLGKIILK
jgi:hypothetical protein